MYRGERIAVLPPHMERLPRYLGSLGQPQRGQPPGPGSNYPALAGGLAGWRRVPGRLPVHCAASPPGHATEEMSESIQ